MIKRRSIVQIRGGFEMIYECPQPTPMIFNLNVHFTHVSVLVGRDDLVRDPRCRLGIQPDSLDPRKQHEACVTVCPIIVLNASHQITQDRIGASRSDRLSPSAGTAADNL